jgi:membrane protease YdiL (CAAX protease family)
MALKMKGYWKETRRPIYSAALILPFLCIYHIGTIALNTTHINGADALIIRLLSMLSVHSMLSSLLVLIFSFTVWQLRTRASWKINCRTLLFSLLESICFALILMASFGWLSNHWTLSTAGDGGSIANVVLYCGAGIYEELIFRGFLVGFLIALFSLGFHLKKVWAAAFASILGALIFAAFHSTVACRSVFFHIICSARLWNHGCISCHL